MLVTINLNIITLVEGLPKTKLLYWDQQYQKICDSEIIKMVQEKNEVYIILDKTIFHPKSGGQPTDIGIIKDSGIRVLNNGIPEIGADGKKVIFLHPKDCNGTLIEIEQD